MFSSRKQLLRDLFIEMVRIKGERVDAEFKMSFWTAVSFVKPMNRITYEGSVLLGKGANVNWHKLCIPSVAT